MPTEQGLTPAPAEPSEPWRSFLRDLDERLKGAIELRCLGGFVVTQRKTPGIHTQLPPAKRREQGNGGAAPIAAICLLAPDDRF